MSTMKVFFRLIFQIRMEFANIVILGQGKTGVSGKIPPNFKLEFNTIHGLSRLYMGRTS